MSYDEAIAYLQGLTQFGMRPGLERMHRMAALAGHPEQSLRFIHVAGTNGKGSTCAFLEKIYREAGLRVGLYTSPHLVHFSERIQINGVPMSDAEVARTVERLRPIAEATRKGEPPTFFEFATLMALDYFKGQQAELVIWETGLGGRLDATNIVTPLASVITNIQFDHEKWLGNSLAEMAAEKAGIIKHGVPVLTATESQEALEVIREVARAQNAPLTALSGVELADQCPMEVSLQGAHQRLNAGLAAATVRQLRPLVDAAERDISNGIGSAVWPGRMQVAEVSPSHKLLLDGAHNLAGVEAFCSAVRHMPCPPSSLIVGMLSDKAVEGMVAMLGSLVPEIFV